MASNIVSRNIPKVQISGLTYDNIIQDVYNLIQDNKALKDNFIDYTSADAGRMMTELFAWITDQLAQRIDIIGNELFLDTVENKSNMLRLLHLIGYKLQLPKSASTTVSVSVENVDSFTENSITVSAGVDDGEKISFSDNSFKKIYHAGSNSIFELIPYNESLKTYDYFSPVLIYTKEPNENMKMFEGETNAKNIITSIYGYSRYTLNGPVIDGSLKIFKTYKTETGYEELLQVDNFFNREAQTSDVPIYKISNAGNGSVVIEFPDIGVVRDEILLPISSDITVLYRVGGGEKGNIGVNTLVATNEVLINNGTKRSFITYRNTTAGNGGVNELDIEKIRDTAPYEIRNRISAVTAEDYEYILKYENSNIRDVKAYGENNIPTVTVSGDDLISLYGYSKNPLDVWIFLIKENLLYSYDIPNITDYINDISFQVFDLNERLNEIYQINKADLNREIYTESLEYYPEYTVGEETINHAYPFDSLQKIKDIISGASALDLQTYKTVISKEPFDSHIGNIDPNTDNEDYLFNNTYSIIGGEKVYRKYITFDSSGNAIPLYEDLTASISKEIEDTTIVVSSTAGNNIFSFTANETQFDITLDDGSYTVGQLCEGLNTKIAAQNSGAFLGVRLYSNITDISESSGITTATGDISVVSDMNTYDFNFVANGESWTDLVDIINSAIEDDGLTTLSDIGITCKLASTVYEGVDCYDLVLYSNATVDFSVSSTTFGITGVDATQIVRVSGDEVDINENDDYFTYSNGILTFVNPLGSGDLIIGDTLFFITLFGVSLDDFYNGEFICSGTRSILMDSNYDYVISTANKLEELPEIIYVSGFWGSEDTVLLGEYYETIESNAYLDIPTEIRTLLKRDKIKNLYNTVFQETSRGEADTDFVDEYNSDYIVKITKKKVNEQTFHQIGITEGYPSVSFSSDSVSSDLSAYSLYVKIDEGNLSVENDYVWPAITIDISEEEGVVNNVEFTNYATFSNGFVEFDLAQIAGKPLFVLTTLLKEVFGDMINIVERDYIFLESATNYYYSGINFKGTDPVVLNSLFVLGNYYQNAFYSSEMYVPAQKIDFLKFTLKPGYHVSNKSIRILARSSSSDTLVDETINTGPYQDDFKENIESAFSGILYIQKNEIFLTSRESGGSFEIIIEGDTEEESNSIKNIFYDFDNISAEAAGETYEVSINKTISGDYYIRRNVDGNFEMKVVNADIFPVGDLYFHVLEDYRIDHLLYNENEETQVGYTNEYIWNSSLENKKMLCVNHIYKQPKFIPFDMKLSISIYKNVGLNKIETFKEIVRLFINDNFNVYTSELGKSIYKDEIAIMLRRNIPGIADVQVEYLGFDIYNQTDDSSYIEPNFNEKLIIASKKEVTEVVSGTLTGEYSKYVTKPVHGLFIDMEYRK